MSLTDEIIHVANTSSNPHVDVRNIRKDMTRVLQNNELFLKSYYDDELDILITIVDIVEDSQHLTDFNIDKIKTHSRADIIDAIVTLTV